MIVLVDGGRHAARWTPAQAGAEARRRDRPDAPPRARDVTPRAGGRAAAGRRRARDRPRPRPRWPAELVGVAQRALEMTRRVRQGPQAVRHAGRRLPGRLATAARRCCSTPRGARRRPTTRPGRPTPTPSACPEAAARRQGRRVRRPAARSPPRRSRSTAASASPGRPTCTGSSAARSTRPAGGAARTHRDRVATLIGLD